MCNQDLYLATCGHLVFSPVSVCEFARQGNRCSILVWGPGAFQTQAQAQIQQLCSWCALSQANGSDAVVGRLQSTGAFNDSAIASSESSGPSPTGAIQSSPGNAATDQAAGHDAFSDALWNTNTVVESAVIDGGSSTPAPIGRDGMSFGPARMIHSQQRGHSGAYWPSLLPPSRSRTDSVVGNGGMLKYVAASDNQMRTVSANNPSTKAHFTARPSVIIPPAQDQLHPKDQMSTSLPLDLRRTMSGVPESGLDSGHFHDVGLTEAQGLRWRSGCQPDKPLEIQTADQMAFMDIDYQWPSFEH